MKIKIKSTNISISPVIEEYVFKKMNMLEKFLNADDGTLCEVELAKNTKHHKAGDLYKAEANITFSGRQYYVVAEKDDIYSAIDEMKDEAERSIVSRRKKYIARARRGATKLKNMIKRFYQ